MNESRLSDASSDAASTARQDRAEVPNTSMLPGSEKAPSAAAGMLKSAVQGAHATIDRLASGAAPVAQKLDDGVAASQEAVRARTDHLRDIRDAWAQGVREKVRSHPLASLAAALALGLVIARINRWRHPMR